jgi:DNA mismatch endonuclease Vsr
MTTLPESIRMVLELRAPSFRGFKASSSVASRVVRANRRTGGRAEQLLRKTLWRLGYRYRTHLRALPGSPDLVFSSARVCVFCDGDFWHGRRWPELRLKLARRAKPSYWISKIARNVEREHRQCRRKTRDVLERLDDRKCRSTAGKRAENPLRVRALRHCQGNEWSLASRQRGRKEATKFSLLLRHERRS